MLGSIREAKGDIKVTHDLETSDLNDIRIFTVVGQEGTLTAAARKLNLPPSTVSRALTRLETGLEVLLVRRSSRGFILTDSGKEYLQSCRRALRTLSDGRNALASQRKRPSGLLRVACPITMVHTLFGPLLKAFLKRYPEIRVELEPYASSWNQEPRDEYDVFFKVRAPRDSMQRVRLYPGVARGIFASTEYVAQCQAPSTPMELLSHTCVGSGAWKLSRGNRVVTPNISFRVAASDPQLHLDLALCGLGIAILPLYMGRWLQTRDRLVPILKEWIPEPIVLCAHFSGPSPLTPKVQVLLDFLEDYIGTEQDPRLHGIAPDGLFTKPTASGKSGP